MRGSQSLHFDRNSAVAHLDCSVESVLVTRALPVMAQEALDLGGVGGQGGFVGRREWREGGEDDLAARHRPGGDGAATDQGERAEQTVDRDQPAVRPHDGLTGRPAEQQRAIVDAFFAAARAGDFDRLMELLDPDVVIRADGGPARPGASVVMRGAAQIARATIATASPQADFTPVLVNGVAGMLITFKGRPVSLIAVTVTGSRITAMDGITDPDRLAGLRLAGLIPGSRD